MSPKFSTFDTAVKPIDDNDLKFVEVAGLAALNQELIAGAEAVESPQGGARRSAGTRKRKSRAKGRANVDDQKRRVAAAFDLAAGEYDAPLRRCFDLHAVALVREARITPGARVLDVATGTGKVALLAARAVAPCGHVTGVDLSEGMLAQARRKAGDLPVEFRQMDAEALEFDDGTFDVVLCGFGVFFPPDVVRGMREMHRVLRPGGRVAFSTWARGAFEPMSGTFLARLDRYGVPRLRSPRTGWMELNDPEHLLVLLQQGGFRDGRAVREPAGYFIEPADWWAYRWPLSRAGLSQLPPESLERFKQETLEDVVGLRTEQGLWLDATALIGVGLTIQSIRTS